jgi:hypothetical protein
MFDTRLAAFRITAPEVPFHANARSNVAREVFQAFRSQRARADRPFRSMSDFPLGGCYIADAT